MSSQEEYQRVPLPALQELVCDILIRYQVPKEHAIIVADVLTSADLRGVESHGVGRLFSYYLGRLERGLMNPRAHVQVMRQIGSTAVLDGDNGLGHVAGYLGMEKCLELAAQHGLAITVVRNSNHYGMAGYYAMMALGKNMIGISLTNSQPLTIPTYGRTRMLGTNPISIAFPGGGEEPFVLDMATSVVAIGKMEVYRRKDLPVPRHWGADRDGMPTSDPNEVIEHGGVFPLGGPAENSGYKGYGLAAVVDILSGVLSGAGFLTGVLRPVDEDPCNVGHFFAAMQVDAFMPLHEFTDRMDQFIRQLRSSPRAKGAKQIFVAGEKEFIQEKRNRQLGVPIHPKVWQSLRDEAKRLGLRLWE